MTSRFYWTVLLGAIGCGTGLRGGAAEPGAVPDFKEVQAVVRQHLAGATDENLNRTAVEGFLLALKGRVSLVTNAATLAATNTAPLVARENLFDGGIGYLRIERVATGLEAAVARAFQSLGASNKLAGLVLDLRFTDGDDYAAAAAVVDLFLSREVPLLNAGGGLISSRDKTNAIRLPVVTLVNLESSAAAETMAAVFRQTGVGLLIGNRTAGRAGVTGDFKLSSGQTLRLVTTPVQLGDAKMIPTTGVVPDIEVAATLEEERAYLSDPFTLSNGTKGSGLRSANTNGLTVTAANKRVRVTEADLVRERRSEGENPDARAAKPRAVQPESPAVQDPALSRAIDLLKGLAVVRQGHF